MEANSPSRRRFVQGAALGLAVPHLLLGRAVGANDRVRVGVMGLGRGRGHINAYLKVPNCEVAWICDVDRNRLAGAAKSIEGKQETAPRQTHDVRRILEQADVDALSIAAPNFWHAPATILACRAGKHVYVEKPGSYDAHEAGRMVAVAADTKRQVQMGTQRRSYPAMIEGMAKLREGVIGELRYARCWYANTRPGIGRGKVVDPPEHLDWTLWQGPLPERPYKDNLVHYNWHWHWFYGGGELANNGVHALDIARWALGVDQPLRVSCAGGRYHHDDDQETPDTCYATYDFGRVGINWESSSCHRRKPEELAFVTVYGEGGSMRFSSANYTVFDQAGKEVDRNREGASDVPHFANFVDAVRGGAKLNQDIANGQASTQLCHLGNIAYRTGGSVEVDSATGRPVGSPDGGKLWGREAYREDWWDLMR